jgi:hypothetical protein
MHGKIDEAVSENLLMGSSPRLSLRMARMMRQFAATYPEDSKDCETVPGDLS